MNNNSHIISILNSRKNLLNILKTRNYDVDSYKNEGINEIGYDTNTNQELIFVSNKYFRPSEVDTLLGNSSKAYQKLGWKPKITFDELVKEMVNNDC